MNTKVIKEFNDEFKEKMFSTLCNNLTALFNSQACDDFTILGNYQSGTFTFDAILLTNTDVFLFEFIQAVSGKIIVNDTGWISKDGPVQCGNHGTDTPWEYVRMKRNVLFGLFKKKGMEHMFIKTIILFEGSYELIRGNTTLNYGNHKWFLTAELGSVAFVLRGNSSASAPINFLKKVHSVLLTSKRIKEVPRTKRGNLWLSIISWWKEVA